MAPTSVPTTGVPHASASLTTFGQPSLELARQKTSAADINGLERSDLRGAVEARWSAAKSSLQAPSRQIGTRTGSKKLG